MQYHVEISDDQHSDFRTAYAAAIGKACENDVSEIAIAVNDIETLDSLIYPVIYGIAAKLKKNGFTDIADIKVYLETKNSRSEFNHGIIIASYVSEKFLQQILSDPRATDTIFITNKANELGCYLANNKSERINGL